MNRFHRFDVLAAWYREYLTVKNYRPRTVKDYCFELSFFRRGLERETDIADIDDITPEILHDYAAGLYDRQCAPKTIHHKLAALRSFFSILYKERKLYTDLTDAMVMPKVGKSLPSTILSEEEAARLFDYLEQKTSGPARSFDDLLNARDRAIMEQLYSTGMRLSELRGLTISDIGFSENVVTIRNGKGGKDRIVPIGSKCAQALDRYIREIRPRFSGPKHTDLLFLNRWGAPLGREGVLDIVGKTVKAAGIDKHMRVHDMRHTCATHMLNHGADIRYVQELLGHASLSSTQVYTHVSINKLKESHRKYHPRERGEFLSDNGEEETDGK
jgi:site-specific recombinase XerD